MPNKSQKRLAAKPILRWAGSKRKLLPVLSALAPQKFERYVEPFAGSACLFFHLSPSEALLGDINSELINAYRQIKWQVKKVIDALSKLPDRSAITYYKLRALDPNELGAVDRAARFIGLNRLCFNGLYRTNTKGHFNVPYGGDKTGDLPTADELRSVSRAFRNVALKAASFEESLAEAKSGDFVYLDPPYSISIRRVFNNYSHNIFGLKDLQKLRSELVRLNRSNVQFLLSYGLSKEGLELAKGFRAKHALVQRQISGFAANRRLARELLITNY